MNNNRRRATRFPLKLPAVVQWEEDNDTRTVQTQTTNISSTGLYLMLEKQHRPSSRIEFEVRLPNSPNVGDGAVLFGRGRLIRQEQHNDHRIGIAAVIERCNIRPAAKKLADAVTRAKAVAR